MQNGNTPLHDAAFNGNTEVVQLLIQTGANLDAVNKVPVYIQH